MEMNRFERKKKKINKQKKPIQRAHKILDTISYRKCVANYQNANKENQNT